MGGGVVGYHEYVNGGGIDDDGNKDNDVQDMVDAHVYHVDHGDYNVHDSADYPGGDHVADTGVDDDGNDDVDDIGDDLW